MPDVLMTDSKAALEGGSYSPTNNDVTADGKAEQERPLCSVIRRQSITPSNGAYGSGMSVDDWLLSGCERPVAAFRR